MLVSKAQAQAAATLLGVELEGLDTPTLGLAFRKHAARYHPDTALKFSADKWAAFCQAKRTLLGWLEKNQPPPVAPANACPACEGRGRILVSKARGFEKKPVTVMCGHCNGAGTLPEEKSRPQNMGD
jgi:DnaJ-class molecular chaperone